MKCDFCDQEIDLSDERVLLHLSRSYPDKSVCIDCDILVTLAKQTILSDILGGLPAGTTAGIMLGNYDG